MAGRKFKEGVDLKRPPYARPQPGDPNHDRMIFRDHTDQTATVNRAPSRNTPHHTEQTITGLSAEIQNLLQKLSLAAAGVAGLSPRAGEVPPPVVRC